MNALQNKSKSEQKNYPEGRKKHMQSSVECINCGGPYKFHRFIAASARAQFITHVHGRNCTYDNNNKTIFQHRALVEEIIY